MCTYMITTIHYRGCPQSCNITRSGLLRCASAGSSGIRCANPKTNYGGQTTSRIQCPRHRDEGYHQN
ncbi:hypothetical protein M441DRAFT_57188 [Trichoderma asperellum CBS 433.97]|uniref:Uncharacterized protein n=1 Tax=Trichoderma asperellum (strain ATCC 204424 / CBS 433.97 / NBRC 101777) TaxID=1042311 RepID=A0A2T3ZCB4_TRIA4|nr:hypothetical protein M441DRAFT_57188 [Trichoderma asperellum CBS 433.97]PTB42439.1 hypothetical protein M441DRAFT_57188 [Trichoderma asperellum CBS 433.97]